MYRWVSVPVAGLCVGEVAVLGERIAIKKNYFDDSIRVKPNPCAE